MAIEPPIASSARNETAPMAVLATAEARPFARALGGEAKRIVLERLVRDPLVVVAADADDPLLRCHGRPPVRFRAGWSRLPRAFLPCSRDAGFAVLSRPHSNVAARAAYGEKPSSVRCKIMHRTCDFRRPPQLPQSLSIDRHSDATSAYAYTSIDVCCIATRRRDARPQRASVDSLQSSWIEASHVIGQKSFRSLQP